MRFAISSLALLCLSFFVSLDSACCHDGVDEMTATANRILATLNDGQKAKCVFEFDSPRRKAWNFVPDKFIQPDAKRYGLVLSEMTSQQRLLTHALLNTVLSNEGYRQTVTIMNLEQVLHNLENQNPIRDPDRYYLSVFGTPGQGQWGWRFEGHHLSLNFTVRDGKLVSSTPSFFGTNPAEVREGQLKGLKTLSAEEALARKLLESLSSEERKAAIVSDKAPADILTGTSVEVDDQVLVPSVSAGLQAKAMSEKQQAMLQDIVDEFLDSYQTQMSELDDSQKKIDADTVFAWMGGTEPGQGHYYRVTTEHLVLEYDNTQNGANHVHLVLRERANDFGVDLLKTHLQHQHHDVR